MLKHLAVIDVTALGDHWADFDKKQEKGGPGFLLSATFMVWNTADMYIRARPNASDK